MLRTIFKAVAVSAVAAFFCVGCGDKNDDGGEEPGEEGGGSKSSYTVTFNPNGGTVSPTSAKTNEDGKLDSLPTPTRTGYDFDGWYTAKTGGAAVAASRTYTANATIYARWTEKSVNPPDTANPANPKDTTGNGASGLVLGIEEAWLFEPEEGETEQSGLIFKQNGTVEVVYTEDGDTWHIAEDERGTYTLSGNNSITVKIFGDTLVMTFSISGNKLTFKYSDGSTDVLTKKNGVKIDDSGEVGETLYTINFDANGGTVSPTSGKTNKDGKLASLPEPTRSGYTFDGWYTAQTGGTEVTASKVYTANTTIYAHWKEAATQPSGGNLVCADGEAWVMSGGNNSFDWGDIGWIFKSNHDLVFIYRDGDKWYIDSDDPDSYIWSTDGNKLTMREIKDSDDDGEVFTYSVSGNTLTTYWGDGGSVIFTKKSVTIGGTSGGGGSLVLPDGEAWKASAEGDSVGYIFLSDGKYQALDKGNDGSAWRVYRSGTYTTNGNSLTFTYDGESYTNTYTYSVSGNTLTLTREDGRTEVYTKKSVTIGGTSGGGNLVCADGEVWVYGDNTTLSDCVGGCDGDVFLSNNEHWGLTAVSSAGTGMAWSKGTWSTNGNQLTIGGSGISTYSVSGNKLTLTFGNNNTVLTKVSGVVWEKVLRVFFDVNGAGGTVSPESGAVGADGKLATLPTPTRNGYVFDGWYTSKTGGTNVTTSTVFNAVTRIYARWTEGSQGGYGSVEYGGKTYKTIQIGTQTWFAENLNYDVPDVTTDVCYDNDPANCTKYGRLYDWETAMEACPIGWSLPTDDDLAAFDVAVGGSAVTKLKSTSGWSNNGTDDFGFSALPGGGGWDYENYGVGFSEIGNEGIWWSDSEGVNQKVLIFRIGYSENVGREMSIKSNLFSVRCVQD